MSLLGGDLAVSNDAYAPCKGATRSVGHVQLGSSLLLGASANALSSSTAQTPTHLDAAPAVNDRSVADATATGVNLTPGAAVVRATVLKSHAEARCGARLGAKPTLIGSSPPTSVTINGQPVVLVNGRATINLVVGVLRINSTTTTATSVTQRAIWLERPGGDVVVAEAKAGYTGNPCK